METRQAQTIDFVSVIKERGFEKALSLAGNFGPYQSKVLFFLSIQWIITSFFLMIQPFLIELPIFLCDDPTNPTGFSVCDEQTACKQGSFTLALYSPKNIVTEFSLYCDRAYLRDLCGTIFFLGGSIGTLLFSRMADSQGGKKALFFAYGLGSISVLLMGLSAYSIVPFYLYLASTWAGFDAYFAFSLILMAEIGGAKLRSITNSFLLVVWGVGLCLYVGFAKAVENRRYEIIFVIAIPACVSLLFFTQIEESPRFLFIKGHYEKCQKVFTSIAKQNQVPIVEDTLPTLVLDTDQTPINRGISATRSSSYFTIIRNSWLRKRFLLFTALIVYIYLSYNGILFALANIGGDIYLNSIIVNVAELSGYIVSIFLINNIKRKTFFKLIMISSAVSALIFALIPYISCQDSLLCRKTFLEELMSLVIKFDISLSFGLIFVYGSELFPTSSRSKCIGLSIAIGRGASMMTTWINHGLMLKGIQPMFFYGALGFFMLFIIAKLPETFGIDLLDWIPDENRQEEDTMRLDERNNNKDFENE